MGKTIADSFRRDKTNVDQRIERKLAKEQDQSRRQREAEEVKIILKTWTGRRTG